MGQLEETNLPGIGRRVEFFSEDGRRVGVVRHHSGRRELFVCRVHDPDTTDVAINLSEGDAHSLVEAFGLETLSDDGSSPRTYDVEGLVFEWLDVPAESPVVGRSIADLQVRTRTGASVVAVIRSPSPVPAPEPEFVVAAEDTLVVAGTAEGVEKARRLLQTER